MPMERMGTSIQEPAAGAMGIPLKTAELTGWRRIFRSLHYRDFALFWTGNFLSNIGTWMQNLAQGWLILVLSNSRFLLGLNGFLTLAPSMIFSLPGGVIADRLNRRKLMLWTQTTMMVLAFVLGALASLKVVTMAEILAISFFTGTASALNNPAYQALVPDLVPHEELLNAIALNSAQFNMSRAVGPTLAGIVLGSLGMAACFYLNGVSFLALIVALLIIDVPTHASEEARSSVWHGMVEGVRYLCGQRVILVLLSLPAFLSLFGFPILILMPAFARDELKLGASGLGYLMAGGGLGAVIAALALATQSTLKGSHKFTVISAIIFSAAMVVFSRTQTFLTAFLMLLVVFAGFVVAMALTNTMLQVLSPPELRGRVMSFYNAATMGLGPIGSLQAGAIAQAYGTRFELALSGLICLVYFSALLILLPHLTRRA
jgi:MFS family permease